MHRLFSRLVPFLVVTLVMVGCGSGDTPTAPDAPTEVQETFSGELTLNGAKTHPFDVIAPGSITAQLSTLSPNSDKPVGLSLGTWNGSICQIILPHDSAVQGALVVGSASTSGMFCVRIYDAAGTVVQPQTYVIDVFHF